MKRLIVLLATIVMLSGCVVHETYREPYYADGRSGGISSGSNGGYYQNDGYYESDDYSGGDYYYGYDSGYGASSSWAVDSPFYSSLFWPLNTWYRDPYWYPGYHYGVTWFPRNYYSFNVGYSSHWSHNHYGYLAYSPYRYSWVDNYYDTRPWHGHNRPYYDYNHYYPLPRYGSAQNEAERLATVRRVQRPVAGVAPRANSNPSPRAANRTPANSGIRGADVRRQDQGGRVFNDNGRTDPRGSMVNPRSNVRPNASGSVVRQPTGNLTREASRITASDGQVRPDRSSAAAVRPMPQSGYQARELPQRSSAGSSVPSRNAERISPAPSVSANPDRAIRVPRQSLDGNSSMRSTAPAEMRRPAARPVESQPVERSYSLPRQVAPAAPATRPVYTAAPERERARAQPVYRAPAAPAQRYSEPAPVQNYSMPQQRQSAPSTQAPSRPQSYSAPEPSSSSRSSDSSSSRSSESRTTSSDNVRRVGSDRSR